MSPSLNLDKLATSVQDTEYVPARRGRTAEPNPFHDVVVESYNNEQGKMIPVPLAGEVNDRDVDVNVVKVVNMLRAAAKAQEVGISIQIEHHSKTIDHVLFLAKDRRSYTKNGDGTENGDEATA